MPYAVPTTPRDFGSTGITVHPLALGTNGWGPPPPWGPTDPADPDHVRRFAAVEDLAQTFLRGDFGINVLDTSNAYGHRQSERFIGRALAEAGGLPSGFLLQTKLDPDGDTGEFTGERMWRSLEESLERLGIDRIQMLYLHDPELISWENATVKGGPLDAIVEMKRQGIAAHIGVSGGPVRLLQRFLDTGEFDALITHNRFTVVDRSAEELIASAHRAGVAVNNAAPYGGGILTGDARFAGTYGYFPIKPEVEKAVGRVADLCADAHVPMAAVALQFSLRDERIALTTVGATTQEKFTQVLDLASVPVPESIWAEIDAVLPEPEFWLDTATE